MIPMTMKILKPRILRKAFFLLAALPAYASAVTVTVNSQQYDVNITTTSYNTSNVLLDSQPWWGDSTLAATFANAVAGDLGLPYMSGDLGPYFAFAYTGSSGLVSVQAYFALLKHAIPSADYSSSIDYFATATPHNNPSPGGESAPEIDALAGTGALALLGFSLALAGERRRKS